MEKVLYDLPSSENFPPECSGCQQNRTAGQPLECPVVTNGIVFEVLLSQKYYPYNCRPKFVVQSWIELQSEDFVFKKQMFPQAYKKIICPLNNQVCHYPDHDCTRSKLLVRNCALLGYYAASIGNSLPTFRDNPSASSSWILDPWRWAR